MSRTATDAWRRRKISLDLTVTFQAEWGQDEHCTPEHYLGKYSNTPEEGAIDREERGDKKSDEYRYWNPENHKAFDPKDWEHVSGKEKQRLIREHGSLENAVKHYREQDYKRHEAFNNGEWTYEFCRVTVRLGKLEATDSLHGIEEPDDKYRRDVENELIRNCVAELRGKLMKRANIE